VDGGRPALPEATVTLARRSPIRGEDLLILATTKTDAAGRCAFRTFPTTRSNEFLAATRPDQPATGLSTAFGPQGVAIEAGDHKVWRDPLRPSAVAAACGPPAAANRLRGQRAAPDSYARSCCGNGRERRGPCAAPLRDGTTGGRPGLVAQAGGCGGSDDPVPVHAGGQASG